MAAWALVRTALAFSTASFCCLSEISRAIFWASATICWLFCPA